MAKSFDIDEFTAWLSVMLKAVGIVEPVLVRLNPGKLDQFRVWIGEKIVLLSGPEFSHFAADHGDDARREFLRQYGAAEVDEQALALEYAYWNARLHVMEELADRLGLDLWDHNPEYDALYTDGCFMGGAWYRGPADAAALARVGFNALVRAVGVRGECSSTPPNIVTPLARELKENVAKAQVAAAFGHAMFAPRTAMEIAQGRKEGARCGEEKLWDDEQPPVLFGGSKTDPHDGIALSLQIGTEPIVVKAPPPIPVEVLGQDVLVCLKKDKSGIETITIKQPLASELRFADGCIEAACVLPPSVVNAEPRARTATEVAMSEAQMKSQAQMKSWWADRSEAERWCDPGLGPKSDPSPDIQFWLQEAGRGIELIAPKEPPAVPAKEKAPWIFPWPEPPGWNG